MRRISVAMCTYNGARFLRDQLHSLTTQKRRPDEAVIFDDCSTDETIHILERWACEAPFPVRIQINPKRLGSTPNFANAIAACTGDLIALCDQDDVWLDHKLVEAEKAFISNQTLGCWFTDALLVDESLNPLPGSLWRSIGFHADWQRKLAGPNRLTSLMRGNFVTGATLVFPARLSELILPIPDGLARCIHDCWIVTVAGSVAPIDFSAKPSMLYRQHSQQQIGAKPKRSLFAEAGRRVTRHRQNIAEDSFFAETLNSRLAKHPEFRATPESRQALNERIAFLEMRGRLPANRLARLRPVAAAALLGTYSRHAGGLRTAAKDLLL